MCTQGWGDFCTLTSDVHTSAKCTICEMYGTERSGFDFWERWRVMMLYSFPLSSGTFSPCGQCESCPPPPFFHLREINSNLNFNAEFLNCLKLERLSLWALTFLLEYSGEQAYCSALLGLHILLV